MFEYLKEDYKNCLKHLLFWRRILNDENYEDIFTKKEIEEQINFYKGQIQWLRKELFNYESNRF